MQLLDWFQSGMVLGQDILKWRSGNRENATPARNFPLFTGMSPSLCEGICHFCCGPRITMVNGVVGFGAARQYNGNTNPQLGAGDVMPGDIVVIGRRDHGDQSFSVQYRAFDPLGSGHADFAENYEFLAAAIAESDALAGVAADYTHVSGLAATDRALLEAAFNAMKVQIELILSNLRMLNAEAYYLTTYIDDGGVVRQGRIRVSELIMWFSRIDFEFHPAGTNFHNGGVGATDVQRGSLFRSADVTLKVDETAFRRWALNADGTLNAGEATWYLIHEMVHATSFGNSLLNRYNNGTRLERLNNAYTQDIARNAAPTAESAVRTYVATTRPPTPTTPAFDYAAASDATTTFVTPTT